MKRRLFLLICLLVSLLSPTEAKKSAAEKMGWKIAMQSFSFHKFTVMESLDKCAELGVKYIEVYPGHRIGGKWGDQTFGLQMDAATRSELQEIAKQKGVKIVGTGVWGSDKKEEWKAIFQLAKDMKMDYITCEPAIGMWDYIEELVKEYDICISVHNHPQPSTYWNPQLLLDAISQRDKRIGSCSDVGHWSREGLNSTDCLRMLAGRIQTLHFKDIEGPKADGSKERHDVIWGTGSLNVKEMMRVLREQKFKGYFTIEYEYNWDNSVPDIRLCLDYFNKAAEELRKE